LEGIVKNVSQTVRVIVVNSDETVASDLRSVLLSTAGVKIVAEIDEPAMLQHALEQFPAELMLVHLDPAPIPMMNVVAPLISAYKDRIAAIAMTEDRDAELVMRAMRAGMREFLWKPFPPEQLAEILRRVGVESEATGKHVSRMICVAGTSGGVGATQLATNLAAEIAGLEGVAGAPGGRPRVACVDLDLRFGQVAMQFDAQAIWTIAELCESPEQIDTQMIERAMFKHSTGVHILARPDDLTQADQISAGQTAGALVAVQEHYDYVIVDLPARFDATGRAVYDMADDFLLVTQRLVPSVRNADRILRYLESTGYPAGRVKLVCNRDGHDAGYLDRGDVESTLRRKLDFILPDDWKASSSAVNMGSPLMVENPKSKLRLAYRAMAEALLAAADSQSSARGASEDGKRGLLGFLTGANA
jgi:pilus assembly protein CpaE